jgi:hypothetical protein
MTLDPSERIVVLRRDRRYCADCRRWVATIRPAADGTLRLFARPALSRSHTGPRYLCERCADLERLRRYGVPQ